MPETPLTGAGGTPHAIELLRDDHRRMQALVEQMNETMDPAARKGIADNLVAEFETHCLLTKELVHPVVRRLGGGGDVDGAESSDRQTESLAEQTAEIDPGDGSFDRLFEGLSQRIQQHVETSDEIILPILEKLGNEELVALGQKILERREEALTEIQEHGPESAASFEGSR